MGLLDFTALIKNVFPVLLKHSRGRIFSCVQPSYEQTVSDLDRSMHISVCAKVTHSSFIGGWHTTKNMASACRPSADAKFIENDTVQEIPRQCMFVIYMCILTPL